MSSNVLVCRANFDLATKYLNAWSKHIVDYALQKSFFVADLNAEQDTLNNFEAALQQYDPGIVVFASHGDETRVLGQEEVLLQAGVNDDLMQFRTAYLIACSTGVALGPSMVSKGAYAYLGYMADFTFMVKPGYDAKPLDDPWAQAFFDSANAVAYSLLDGKTLIEVYRDGVARFDYWINQWWNDPDPSASEIIQWLEWNKNNLIVITEDESFTAAPKPALKLSSATISLALGIIGLALLNKKS